MGCVCMGKLPDTRGQSKTQDMAQLFIVLSDRILYLRKVVKAETILS